MEDVRIPFAEAKREFVAFLGSQGWPTELLWLSRDRLAGRRRTHWVFRPEELVSDEASRVHYEAARRTASSIRLDAKWRLGGRSLVFVEDYGGDRRMLNFGVATDAWPLRRVSSRARWVYVRAVTGLLGNSPFLSSTRLPPTHRSGVAAV
jgi:hypothetical protein